MENLEGPVVFVRRVEIAVDLAIAAQLVGIALKVLPCGVAVDPAHAKGQRVQRVCVGLRNVQIGNLQPAKGGCDVIPKGHEFGDKVDQAKLVLELDVVPHRVAAPARPRPQRLGKGFQIAGDHGRPKLAVGFPHKQNFVIPHPVDHRPWHHHRTAQLAAHLGGGFARTHRALDGHHIGIIPIIGLGHRAGKLKLIGIWHIANGEIAL